MPRPPLRKPTTTISFFQDLLSHFGVFWIVRSMYFGSRILNLGMGHWAWGMGHWAWGIGNWALGIGHWALGIGHWALALTNNK
jgi:hypothetical protein